MAMADFKAVGTFHGLNVLTSSARIVDAARRTPFNHSHEYSDSLKHTAAGRGKARVSRALWLIHVSYGTAG